jgi:hypothetical protein
MSCKPVLLVLAILAPWAAQAQTDTTAATASEAVAPSATLDMPIEKIAQTPDGCAVLDKDFPGLREHPMYSSFKRMSLNQIAAMSSGKITPEMMAQASADLSALTPATPAPVAISATPVNP